MNASPIRCLLSAGPTREFFDPVRFLSNPSTGKMGYALAAAAAEAGWVVDLVSGPVALQAPHGVAVEQVVTGAEMYEAIARRFPLCDILIMTAAIMDYRPKMVADHKIKKFELEMRIEMEPVIDVLATVARTKTHQLVVGFAAETNNLDDYAQRKLADKNADFIVANRIGQPGSGFASDTNQVRVFARAGGHFDIGPEPKITLARKLIDHFAAALAARPA